MPKIEHYLATAWQTLGRNLLFPNTPHPPVGEYRERLWYRLKAVDIAV